MPSLFLLVVELEFHHVGQAGLELLTSGDPPTLASQSTDVNYHAWPSSSFLKMCSALVFVWKEIALSTPMEEPRKSQAPIQIITKSCPRHLLNSTAVKVFLPARHLTCPHLTSPLRLGFLPSIHATRMTLENRNQMVFLPTLKPSVTPHCLKKETQTP
ncbi:hypothetical protein AAY473_031618 [Plecturocebus cupreus]